MPYDPDSRELHVPFMNDDPQFALGCEFGMVYSRLNNKRVKSYRGMLHRANEERLCLMATRLGYTVMKRKKVVRGWFYLHVKRKES